MKTIKIIKVLLLMLLAGLSTTQCKFFHKKNTYSNLPADTAQYLMWCDELAEDSNNAEVLFHRGEYLFKKKFFVKALADANRATILDTTKAPYFLLLGDICFAVNKTKIAVTAYQRCKSIDPENYQATIKLGELFYIVKEHAQSIQQYDLALKLQSDCEACYFYKGLNFREMTKLPEHMNLAVQMFQKTLSLNQNYFDAYIQLGEIYESKNPVFALEYYNGALRIQPKSVEALYHRAYHFQMRHSYDSAGADYKQILDINPNFVNAYFNVAYMIMEQRRWKAAIEGFKLVVKMDNMNAGAWYNLGECYRNTGEKVFAKQAYSECLMVDKEYPLASERLLMLK